MLYKNTRAAWTEDAGAQTEQGGTSDCEKVHVSLSGQSSVVPSKNTQKNQLGTPEFQSDTMNIFAEVFSGMIGAAEDIYTDEQKQELFELQRQTDFMPS